MNRRTFIGGGAALAGGIALALEESSVDGGFAEVSWPKRKSRDVPLLPAGARSVARFESKCVGCGLCAAKCPSKCLRLSTDSKRLGRVELDYRFGWCKPTCVTCAEVCPANALEKVSPIEKRNIHVGRATIDQSLCLRKSEGVNCHACEKHCPAKAIRIVNGIAVVDQVACIGCGACECYCPVRPMTAVCVEGYERHHERSPMSDRDLIAEMRHVLDGGKAYVIAHGGVIVKTGEGKGVKPLLDLLDSTPELLRGALVMDRIVGRASAAICIVGGAAKVCAPVMAEDAKRLLDANGVASEAGETVPRILNRERTGGCPLDAKAEGLSDPKAIVNALRK